MASAPQDVDLLPVAGSYLLASAGRFTEALALTRSAYDRDRLHINVTYNYANVLFALGQVEEAIAIYEEACRRWPSSFVLLRSLILSAACTGRWKMVDRWLTPVGSALSSSVKRSVRNAVLPTLDILRHPTPERCVHFLQRLADDIRRAGQLRFGLVALAAELCDLDQVFELVARASFAALFEPGAIIRPGKSGPSIILSGVFGRRLHSDIRFVSLCARLGLVQHWAESDSWPDCADWAPYNFRAEARRLSGSPSDSDRRKAK